MLRSLFVCAKVLTFLHSAKFFGNFFLFFLKKVHFSVVFTTFCINYGSFREEMSTFVVK